MTMCMWRSRQFILLTLLACHVVSGCAAGSHVARPEPTPALLGMRHLAVRIHRSPSAVYSFITDRWQEADWAHGLGADARAEDGEWLASGPVGRLWLRFTPVAGQSRARDAGPSEGNTVRTPIRIVPDELGSVVIFTLMSWPDATTQDFDRYTRTVRQELATVKQLLESS
jgi:hypothetical protein